VEGGTDKKNIDVISLESLESGLDVVKDVLRKLGRFLRNPKIRDCQGTLRLLPAETVRPAGPAFDESPTGKND
jgi:hypothetical protein